MGRGMRRGRLARRLSRLQTADCGHECIGKSVDLAGGLGWCGAWSRYLDQVSSVRFADTKRLRLISLNKHGHVKPYHLGAG